MTFYQEMSRYYDEIFAVRPGELDFLKRRLAGAARLLDVGCGTGNKTELLAEAGREIVGLDLDAGMIAQAGRDHAASGVTYQVGDMSAIGLKFSAGRFDGLVCLGNTLVHLVAPFELETFMVGVERVLTSGGLLAVQILNYDFIVKERLAELPLIETAHTVFRRFYDWSADGGLSFRTRLEVKGGPVHENAIPLLPLVREQIIGLLGDGFGEIEFFGGLDGRPYAPDGLPLMLLARKK